MYAADTGYPPDGYGPLSKAWDDLTGQERLVWLERAAAAIRVCLASDEVAEAVAPLIHKARVEERERVLTEAQRAVDCIEGGDIGTGDVLLNRRDVLAALAALAEDTP